MLAQEGIRDVTVSTLGGYNTDQAAEVVRGYLKRAYRDNKPFQVIYNTGDSMTLGTVNANADIRQREGCAAPYAIGYDGIDATKRLTARGEMAGVVMQDPKQVARAAVDQLWARIWDIRPMPKIIKLKPGFLAA